MTLTLLFVILRVPCSTRLIELERDLAVPLKPIDLAILARSAGRLLFGVASIISLSLYLAIASRLLIIDHPIIELII